MKIILINGAPRSGKDMVGVLLKQMLPGDVILTKFAMALKIATHGAFALLRGEPQVPPPDAFEDSKDEPSDFFCGITPRQAYIAMSEEYVKPLLGPGAFGELLAEKMRRTFAGTEEKPGKTPDFVVITDCGFPAEVEVLADEFGKENCVILQVVRRGTSFDGDSRGHLDESLGIPIHVLPNHGSLSQLREQVAHFLTKYGV